MSDLIKREDMLNMRFTEGINEDGVLYVSFREVMYNIRNAPSVDAEEVVYCWKCKHWDRDDKVFCDFDGKQWHGCKMLYCFTSASGEPPMTPDYFYCGDGEKKDDGN